MKGSDRSLARFLGPLLAVTLAAGTVLAQDSPDELARRHFESGVAYLQESDYDNALKAFEKAYELSKRPEILLNIATVHERRSDLKNAVTALKQYLDVAPQGDQRATVESRIANLEKRIEAESQPKQTDAGTAQPGTAPTSGPSQPDKPVEKGEEPANVPAFVLLGVGAVAAGGAVLTGFLAKGEYDDAKKSCSPHCSNDDVSAGKTLALTSTILTGVAVVSAGVGAVLLFSQHPSEKSAKKPAPRWSVGFAPLPKGAAAGAGFSF